MTLDGHLPLAGHDRAQDSVRHEVGRCLAIGKSCPGYLLAVGNHIPANTPVESALWYQQCYEELSRR